MQLKLQLIFLHITMKMIAGTDCKLTYDADKDLAQGTGFITRVYK